MLHLRNKNLNRKQTDKASLEQFWEVFVELAKKCDISGGEDEWMRDIFLVI